MAKKKKKSSQGQNSGGNGATATGDTVTELDTKQAEAGSDDTPSAPATPTSNWIVMLSERAGFAVSQEVMNVNSVYHGRVPLYAVNSAFCPMSHFEVYEPTPDKWAFIAMTPVQINQRLESVPQQSLRMLDNFVSVIMGAGLGSRREITTAQLVAYFQDVESLMARLAVVAGAHRLCNLDWYATFKEVEPKEISLMRDRMALDPIGWRRHWVPVFEAMSQFRYPGNLLAMAMDFYSPFRPDLDCTEMIIMGDSGYAELFATSGATSAAVLLEAVLDARNYWLSPISGSPLLTVLHNFFPFTPVTFDELQVTGFDRRKLEGLANCGIASVGGTASISYNGAMKDIYNGIAVDSPITTTAVAPDNFMARHGHVPIFDGVNADRYKPRLRYQVDLRQPSVGDLIYDGNNYLMTSQGTNRPSWGHSVVQYGAMFGLRCTTVSLDDAVRKDPINHARPLYVMQPSNMSHMLSGMGIWKYMPTRLTLPTIFAYDTANNPQPLPTNVLEGLTYDAPFFGVDVSLDPVYVYAEPMSVAIVASMVEAIVSGASIRELFELSKGSGNSSRKGDIAQVPMR